jgi:hypothetical protein
MHVQSQAQLQGAAPGTATGQLLRGPPPALLAAGARPRVMSARRGRGHAMLVAHRVGQRPEPRLSLATTSMTPPLRGQRPVRATAAAC